MRANKTIRVDLIRWEKVAGYLKQAGFTRGMSGLIDDYLEMVLEAFEAGFDRDMTDEEAREYLRSKLK